LTVKADARKSGQQVNIGVAVAGQAGEEYPSGVTINGRRQAAPKVRIEDDKGKTLASGQFEYG
jgi:hypothetical protein